MKDENITISQAPFAGMSWWSACCEGKIKMLYVLEGKKPFSQKLKGGSRRISQRLAALRDGIRTSQRQPNLLTLKMPRPHAYGQMQIPTLADIG